jgi:hypothetical protein
MVRYQTQSIARIIKHSCNWRAIKGRVDDHNSLIYKQIPANLWPARNDAIDQLRAKVGYIDQTQEETHQSIGCLSMKRERVYFLIKIQIKYNYQYINDIQ